MQTHSTVSVSDNKQTNRLNTRMKTLSLPIVTQVSLTPRRRKH